MTFASVGETTAEFLTVQKDSVTLLNRLADEGGIPGFEDLDRLRELVTMAEPVNFDRRGTLRLTTQSGSIVSPKVIMAKSGDPTVHKIKYNNRKLSGYGYILDRSRRLANPNIMGFINSTVFADGTVVPIVITLKPRPAEMQAGSLTHEITHWMDHLGNMDDTALEEKRAHFVGYYLGKVAGSELYISPDVALERAHEQMASNGAFEGIVTSSLVALSTAEDGHHDLSKISDTERDLFHKIGAY